MDNAKNGLIFDEMSEKIIEAAEKMAISIGAHKVTVRKILQSLDITNRVFYNRFHNIDEVLRIVYKKTVEKIHEDAMPEIDEEGDFFEYVMSVVENALVASYDTKRKLSSYFFETDSISDINYSWWRREIKRLIDYAKTKGYIRNVDSEVMSYAIWCFCRGYNADAVSRGIPKEEAVKNFRYSFGFLLDGLKQTATET